MTKKLLIVNNNLAIGGIQKSLVNLLWQVRDKYDITLLLLSRCGELMDTLPPNVRIIEPPRRMRIMGMSQSEAKKAGFYVFALRTLCALWTKVFSTRLPFFLLTRSYKMDELFDYAVSFMQNASPKLFYGGCNEVVLNCVRAEKKVGFIHCDYKNYEGNCRYNIEICRRLDAIAACSTSCRERFLEVVPDMAGRVFAVHNCYNFDELRQLGEEYEAELPDTFNVLTVARISEEKGILRMLPIIARLRENHSFVWHIVGDGVQRDEALKTIEKLNLENTVILHGQKRNPYPYFKKADLLLVPSYNEAAPMVYGEAEFFSLPILTTDTTSARELVEKRGCGLVCENTAEGIESALQDAIVRKSPKHRSHKVFDNLQAATEFERLFPA
ncbi:MAG: glycosyltransferase [Clostridia bacterium]|nr:glycosyltransferase [Clostridia bacterium]